MSNVRFLSRRAAIEALQLQGFVLVQDVIAAGKALREVRRGEPRAAR